MVSDMENNEKNVNPRKIKWMCLPCGIEFISTDTRHRTDYCPNCGENGVDHEREYVRILGKVKFVGDIEK